MSQKLITHLESTLTNETLSLAYPDLRYPTYFDGENTKQTDKGDRASFVLHNVFTTVLSSYLPQKFYLTDLENLKTDLENYKQELDLDNLINYPNPDAPKDLWANYWSETFDGVEFDDQEDEIHSLKKEFYENLFLNLLDEAINHLTEMYADEAFLKNNPNKTLTLN